MKSGKETGVLTICQPHIILPTLCVPHSPLPKFQKCMIFISELKNEVSGYFVTSHFQEVTHKSLPRKTAFFPGHQWPRNVLLESKETPESSFTVNYMHILT